MIEKELGKEISIKYEYENIESILNNLKQELNKINYNIQEVNNKIKRIINSEKYIAALFYLLIDYKSLFNKFKDDIIKACHNNPLSAVQILSEYQIINLDVLININKDELQLLQSTDNYKNIIKKYRTKLIHIISQDPECAYKFIRECKDNVERQCLLNSILKSDTYSFKLRKLLLINLDSHKKQQLTTICCGNDYYIMKLIEAHRYSYIKLNNIEKWIIIDRIIELQDNKLAEIAYHKGNLDLSQELKEKLEPLLIMNKLNKTKKNKEKFINYKIKFINF
jgi:hypothetical protein